LEACMQGSSIILVDGFISGVAALAAILMCPPAINAILLTHASQESGTVILLEAFSKLGVLPPPLSMGLCLGEATGALLCLPILRAANAVLCNMGSLQETLSLGNT
jgi:nicotinate-nucleotide--dimethylbenzimidazole phosphoribosyltransferase